jgi:hypothetical protein
VNKGQAVRHPIIDILQAHAGPPLSWPRLKMIPGETGSPNDNRMRQSLVRVLAKEIPLIRPGCGEASMRMRQETATAAHDRANTMMPSVKSILPPIEKKPFW